MSAIEAYKKNGLLQGPKVIAKIEELYPDIGETELDSPSKAFSMLWSRYPQGEKGMNGKVFEALLAVILYRRGIKPLYIQAKAAFVPNVDFDFLVYDACNGPIAISAKTSLRERYKQAALEGMALQQVYRKAKSYLLTLNAAEAATVNKKIITNDVLGLHRVIDVCSTEFDTFLSDIAGLELIFAGKVPVITYRNIVS